MHSKHAIKYITIQICCMFNNSLILSFIVTTDLIGHSLVQKKNIDIFHILISGVHSFGVGGGIQTSPTMALKSYYSQRILLHNNSILIPF